MGKEHVDFDQFAGDYRNIHTESVNKISGTDSEYFGKQKVEVIWGYEKTSKKVKVLDLGCGDGLNSFFFKRMFEELEYVGIDVSKESIKEAEKKYAENNIGFSVYDGQTIPFANETFDIILVACVLHHVSPEEHESLLKECKRVLKPSGALYIFEHNPYNPVTQKIVKDCPFDEDAILISCPKLKKKLKLAGFNKLISNYTIFFPRKGLFNKILFLEKFFKWLPLGGQYFIRCKYTC